MRFGACGTFRRPTPRAITHMSALLDARRDGRSMLVEAGPLALQLAGFRARLDVGPPAVWSSDRSLELFTPKDPAHVSYSAVDLRRASETVRVPASSIAPILGGSNASRLTLLKLDTKALRRSVAFDARGRYLSRPAADQVRSDQPTAHALFSVYLLRTCRELRAGGLWLVHRGAPTASSSCVRDGSGMRWASCCSWIRTSSGRLGGAQIPRDIAIGLAGRFGVQVLCSKDQYPDDRWVSGPDYVGIRVRRVHT